MKIALANQMRDIDKNVIENYGLPELSLMESAGHRVAQAVRRVLKSVAKKSICIAAGSGNNGGDALTAARYLSNLGARSKVFILEGKSGRSESLDVQMRFADAVIDGLLGTGFSDQLRPSALRFETSK